MNEFKPFYILMVYHAIPSHILHVWQSNKNDTHVYSITNIEFSFFICCQPVDVDKTFFGKIQ